jgi:flagellar hook-associated protein 2
MTGINSGLDTDSIIQELMSAYNMKTEKYEKEQTKISWKQEIWSDLNEDVNSFYKSVSNLKYSSGWNLYKASSSDSTKASVSVSGTVAIGTQKLHVLKTAQSAYMTGGKMSTTDGSTLSSDTKLYQLGFSSSSSKLVVKTKDDDGNDVSKTVSLTNTSTISDVISGLQDAGLNASFDSANGRIYLSSKKTGEASDFELMQINSSGLATSSGALLSTLGLMTADAAKVTSSSTMSELGYSGDGGRLRISTTKTVNLLDDTGNLMYNDDGTVKTTDVDVYSYIDFNEYTKVSDVIDAIAADDNLKDTVSAELDANGKLVLTNKIDSSKKVNIAETSKVGIEVSNSTLVNSLEKESTGYDETAATKISGSDAAIVLNGVVYSGSSNTFNINGVSVTATGTTDDEADWTDAEGKLDKAKAAKLGDSTAINITTSVDSQGIYDKIKDFLTSYNTIINKLTKLYNADSASDYEPLTDDEKDSMSDTEISKWETKIKDSLLRRDTSLSTLMSAMKNAMSTVYTVNSTKYALSSFGISTLYYGSAPTNEESAYHIDGDEDDENTSGNTDKLLAAINSNPDDVVDFMKQLATSLYSSIDEQMQSSTVRSRYCIYNDKELQDQYDNYTTIIDDWEDKVQDKEDYYYEMFSKMETSLATINSQQSALSGLVG